MGSSIYISEYGGDCQFCGKATTHDEQFHSFYPDVPMVASVESTNGVICSVCEEDPEGFDAEYGAESKTLDYTGNFSGSHDGVNYDVSYECSHDIDSSYEAEIRDYVEEKISNGYDSGYESFEMSTGFYEGEIEIEGTVTWESSEGFDAEYGADIYISKKMMEKHFGIPNWKKMQELKTAFDNPNANFPPVMWDAYYDYVEPSYGLEGMHDLPWDDFEEFVEMFSQAPYFESLREKKTIPLPKSAETFDAPTGYTERGPRPFYGNPRKMALDRWGNRRFIRRRKDGTYMKNVDVGRSLAMDRRRQSQTWAPAGFRDQGDGSPPLLVRLLDMFKGVDEEVLMAESYLMCADCDNYSSECGCHNSESDAYIYAYNDGHSDGRANTVNYRPSTTDRELTAFKKIFKQAEDENLTVNQQKLSDAFEEYGYYDVLDSDPTIITGMEIADQKTFQKLLKVCQENDGIIDSSHPAEAYIIAIKCWQSIFQ